MSGRDDKADGQMKTNPSELQLHLKELWGPNICGSQLTSVKCWLLHQVGREDTLTSLALKYDTSIGKICRANRMQWQDVLLTRRQVWVPVRLQKNEDIVAELTKRMGSRILNTSVSFANPCTHPPHFHRQSSANPDAFAKDRDPLLITSEHMSIEE
ncbi:uncharacterized protein [Drosophila pseudoobscura]|uniref:LysM domain-containing protein n=1 Tax=Drosophila pseudoobscura pseudoobscura TaxID=46245 RepID=A0A6I8UHL0_DROPS|nr:uncharacterized protein LOC4815989 [Drosophila pseudoobscura]